MAPDTAQPQGRGTRRHQICQAALDLAASGGNRAVTHHAIDDHLGIARGSASYYYRTRHDLLQAAITYLTEKSRDAFQSATQTHMPGIDPAGSAADLIAGQLDLLLAQRRGDLLARYALAADAAHDNVSREALAGCLFSLPAAQELMRSLGAADPSRAAHDLLSLLEGLLFDRLYGSRSLRGIHAGTSASTDDLRPVVHRWLTALGRC